MEKVILLEGQEVINIEEVHVTEEEEREAFLLGCRGCYNILNRLAKSTLTRYAQGKGYTITVQDIEDSLQSAIEYIVKHNETWEESCRKAYNHEGHLIPPYALFARVIRNRYKNLLHSYVKRESTIISLDGNEEVLTRIPCRSNHYASVDRQLTWEKVLHKEDYTVAKLMLAGYSQVEIAKRFQVSKQAINKRTAKIREALELLQ